MDDYTMYMKEIWLEIRASRFCVGCVSGCVIIPGSFENFIF